MSVVVTFLLLGTVSCTPLSTPTPTVLLTTPHTPSPASSRIPLPTITHVLATTTALPTVTMPLPTPSGLTSALVWRILFRGFPCKELAMCVPFSDTQYHYYSINNDGTDLKQLQISSFPPTPSLPEGSLPAAGGFNAYPHSSPDDSSLVYVGSDNGVYIANKKSGKASLLFRPENVPDTRFFVGPVCWSSDGLTIKFVVRSRRGNEGLPPEFYVIDRNGSNLRLLFTLPGLEDMAFGDCSPNGQELAFSVPESPTRGKVGLYVINLDSGKWRHILTDYYVWAIRTAPVEN